VELPPAELPATPPVGSPGVARAANALLLLLLPEVPPLEVLLPPAEAPGVAVPPLLLPPEQLPLAVAGACAGVGAVPEAVRSDEAAAVASAPFGS